MAVKESELAELFGDLVAQIRFELKWYRDNDIPVPAADKAVIVKLLKDNEITCDPADASDLVALREQFKEASQSRMAEAAKRAGKALELAEQDVLALYGGSTH